MTVKLLKVLYKMSYPGSRETFIVLYMNSCVHSVVNVYGISFMVSILLFLLPMAGNSDKITDDMKHHHNQHLPFRAGHAISFTHHGTSGNETIY